MPNKPGHPSTQEHILAQAMRDNTIILRSGELAAVIEVEGIDLTRLSDSARDGLIAQYGNFLLTLRFPYQIVVARKRQRLEEYLDYVDGEAQKRQREGNATYSQALYGWINFMLDVVRQVNPQAPLYLIVLPYDPISPDDRVRNRVLLTAEKFQRGLAELRQRSEQVIRGLTRIGLGSRRLADQELVAVLHRVYHPSLPDYRVPPTVRLKSLIAEHANHLVGDAPSAESKSDDGPTGGA
jgi:type IV secretory pathway VirB4 component